MKPISFVLFAFFTFLAGLLCFLNISNVINLELGSFVIRVNVGFLVLGAAFYGSFATMFLLIFQGKLSSANKKLERKVENTKLQAEIEGDKVKQLEAKVKTLEKALESVTRS